MARGGDIKKVRDLFEKYKKTLIAPQASVISCFTEVVEDVLGIKVPARMLTYKPGSKTLAITGGGPLKSEIQLHKEEILMHMKGRLGEKSAPKTIL